MFRNGVGLGTGMFATRVGKLRNEGVAEIGKCEEGRRTVQSMAKKVRRKLSDGSKSGLLEGLMGKRPDLNSERA